MTGPVRRRADVSFPELIDTACDGAAGDGSELKPGARSLNLDLALNEMAVGTRPIFDLIHQPCQQGRVSQLSGKPMAR